ncbi:MAG: hypothetical protein KJN67_00095 [Pontiella sp.]|nr:hypothetical protein [Pontiella sp.]
MRNTLFQPLEHQAAWKAHLQDVFASLEIDPDHTTEQVSISLSLYCREFHPGGVQRSDLVLLIARAFCAVNEVPVAERVLGSMQPHRRHVSRWLEILSELHHFPALLPYFSQGIIRPADWAGARVDRMWTLDFSRLQLSDAEKHEITLYRCIRTMLENMLSFWDETSGEGVLGLKGLASLNVEEGAQRKQTLTNSDDLLEYITDLLSQQKEPRDWQAVPSLLNLDL